MKKLIPLFLILLLSQLSNAQLFCGDNDMNGGYTKSDNGNGTWNHAFAYQWTFFEEVEEIKFSVAGTSNHDYNLFVDDGEIMFDFDSTQSPTLCIVMEAIDFLGNLHCMDSICYGPPLPVEVKSYTVREVDGKALIKVVTLAETDNERLEFYHAVGKAKLEMVGQLPGRGTTELENTYEFVAPLEIGENYYAVKQIDYDGSFEWLGMRGLQKEVEYSVYPVPTYNTLNVVIDGQTHTIDVSSYPAFQYHVLFLERHPDIPIRFFKRELK